jgi:type I restriction enzyme S subunit
MSELVAATRVQDGRLSFNLPQGWRAERLHDVASLQTSNVDKKSVEGERPVKLCNYVDVYYNDAITSDIDFMTASATDLQIERFTLHAGDVVFTKDSESPDDIGIPALVKEEIPELVCGYHLAILRPFGELLNGPYLFYALGARTSAYQFYLAANGVTRYGLTHQGTKNIRIAFPSLEQQTQIAAFLDWKTSQIDALIAKKQTLLQKLKEKRLAVITQVVTKGLNPDAPMRDSGIAWLGEVPSHWEVKPVKFLTKIVRGQFSHRPRNDPAFYDGDYPFVQTGDIARAGKFVTTYSQTLNERGLSVSRQFPAGTLVMTIAANIGDMAIIDFPACFPDSIVGFVPEERIDLNFLYFMFIAMKQRLMMTAVLNTQLNLNIDRIASIETVTPPYDEQIRIVQLLDEEVKRSDLLMGKAESVITRLTEYRSALITAATTGKIDLRGWQPEESNP